MKIHLSLLIVMFFCIGQARVEKVPPAGRNPSNEQVTPTEQSDWIDANLPRLVDAMRQSAAICAKVAGDASIVEKRPFPIVATPIGLSEHDRKTLTIFINDAISANRRYGRGVRAESVPSVIVMPRSRIVRAEFAYPAPDPTENLEPQPLTIDVWVCPDRLTAVALFWLRDRGFRFLDTASPERISESVEFIGGPFNHLKLGDQHPGEIAYWGHPKVGMSAMPTKGQKNIPPDRLVFLRDNLVIEASTDEFVWNVGLNQWVAYSMTKCAPDVSSLMQLIDVGIMKNRVK